MPFAHSYLSLVSNPESTRRKTQFFDSCSVAATPVIASSLSVYVQHILTVQHGVTSTAFMTAIKSRDRAEDVAVLELFSEENGREIKLLQYKDCYKVRMNVLYSILIYVSRLSFIL